MARRRDLQPRARRPACRCPRDRAPRLLELRRRADDVRTSCLCGIVAAARLQSVDLTAGSGTILLDAISAAVIGGTSLFGGRGFVKAALLGALVTQTIQNGIDLVGYSDAVKDIVTGAILLAAVTLDTVSRRRLAASGR
jgi:D-xylose transport system permease protein